MARARSVLDRMIQAMNRGEPVRLNVYADFKMKDVDVFAKPKRKKGTPAKKQSTARTFRKPCTEKETRKEEVEALIIYHLFFEFAQVPWVAARRTSHSTV